MKKKNLNGSCEMDVDIHLLNLENSEVLNRIGPEVFDRRRHANHDSVIQSDHHEVTFIVEERLKLILVDGVVKDLRTDPV